MKNIFTYPSNGLTKYIDPDYYGDDSVGWKKRIDDLLAGNYFANTGAVAPPESSEDTTRFLAKYIDYYDNIGDNNVSLWDFNRNIGIEIVTSSGAIAITSIVTDGNGDHLLTTYKDHGLTQSSGQIYIRFTATPDGGLPETTYELPWIDASVYTFPNTDEILVPGDIEAIISSNGDSTTIKAEDPNDNAEFKVLPVSRSPVYKNGYYNSAIKFVINTPTENNTEYDLTGFDSFYHFGLLQNLQPYPSGATNPYGDAVTGDFNETGYDNKWYFDLTDPMPGSIYGLSIDGRTFDLWDNTGYSDPATSTSYDWSAAFLTRERYYRTTDANNIINEGISRDDTGGYYTTMTSSALRGWFGQYGLTETVGLKQHAPSGTVGNSSGMSAITLVDGVDDDVLDHIYATKKALKTDSYGNYHYGYCWVDYFSGPRQISSSDPSDSSMGSYVTQTQTNGGNPISRCRCRTRINSIAYRATTEAFSAFWSDNYYDASAHYYRFYKNSGDRGGKLYLFSNVSVTYDGVTNEPNNMITMKEQAYVRYVLWPNIEFADAPDFSETSFSSGSNPKYTTDEAHIHREDYSYVVSNDFWNTASSRPYFTIRDEDVTKFFYGSRGYSYIDADGVKQGGITLDDSIWRPGVTYSSSASGNPLFQLSPPTVSSGFDSSFRCNSLSISGGLFNHTSSKTYLQPFLEPEDETPNPLTATEIASAEDNFGLSSDTWYNNLTEEANKIWPEHIKPMEATVSMTTPSLSAVSKSGVKFTKGSGFTRTVLSLKYPVMTMDDFKLFQSKFLLAQGKAATFKLNIQLLDNFTMGFKKHSLSSLSNTVPRVLKTLNAGNILIGGFQSNETGVIEEGQIVWTEGGKNGASMIALADCDANVYGEALLSVRYNDFKTHNTGDVVNYDDDYLLVSLSADSIEYQQLTSGHVLLGVDFDLDHWK